MVNKKLENLAFQACNKEEYAQSILDEKLQKYDIKMYMKQRAINHGAAKKIFKLVKSGKAFGFVLVAREKKMASLNKKRDSYIKSLEKILWSELGTKDDYANEYQDKPLGELVREIVEVYNLKR